MPVKEVHSTQTAHNVESNLAAGYDYDDNDVGDGDIQIDVEEYLRAARRPVEVSRKNMIICTIAFALLITTITVYVTWLVINTAKHKDIAVDNGHFSGPTISVFILMFCDILVSFVGIWTCLKKTGPQPMIYTCIWLLLSSLVNLCVTISLTFETKTFRDDKNKRCEVKDGKISDECEAYSKITTILWCSLLFFVLKFIVIILCRFNYPQVFNWMMGKDVYVDEELIRPAANKNVLSNSANFVTAFFDPPDIARIAARGSLLDGIVEASSNSQAIFVTKGDEGDRLKVEGGPDGTRRSSKRRSTLVAL